MINTERSPKRLFTVIVVLAPLVVMYSVSAFVFWNFNPGEWTETARFFTALFGFIFSVLSVCLYRGMP